MKEVHSQLVDVVLLTQENGSTMLCRGGEEAVRRFWEIWPIVKAEFTGEKLLLQSIDAYVVEQSYEPSTHM